MTEPVRPAFTVLLVALEALTLEGRAIAPGEVFRARAIDAAVLTYHKQADFARRPAGDNDANRLSPNCPHRGDN
ncbi:MAG: hypothetical protein KBA95_13205 [Acidobacteria bacterium]|nr:hypothetical protein [Acidobacteriota bacterium]